MTAFDKKVLVVGISGVTCSGKTTIAAKLNKLLPDAKLFSQDDYFFEVDDPRHVWIKELNHINFDIISSLDMDRMIQDVTKHVMKKAAIIKTSEKFNGNNMIQCFQNQKFENLSKIKDSQYHIVIVEGFCILNCKPLADLCDLKYYFTLDHDECFRRRSQRVYEPPDCPGYFEKCAWPEHLQHIAEIREKVENVTYLDGNATGHTVKILDDIAKALK